MDDLLKHLIQQVHNWRGDSTSTAQSDSGFAIPLDFGFLNGERVFSIGDYTATVRINAQRRTQISWLKDDKVLKTTPAAVKKIELIDAYDDMKSVAEQVQKLLSATREELDKSYIEGPDYSYRDFCLLLHEHPVLKFLSQKLIWVFMKNDQDIPAFWLGSWRTADHQKIEIDDSWRVQLWHPVFSDTNTVLAWRQFMMEYEIVQPFKQAFREVYLLTDAEQNTGTYSNRMAAHILRSKQLYSLAKLRGWKFNPYGFDGIVEKKIPLLKIKIQFWVDQIDEGWESGQPFVATDQVRFCKLRGADVALPLHEIPKVLFSEAMRDIDLFVGVTSIGNDPNWQDNNGNPRQFDAYWNSYSFGELTESAKTRKMALDRLVPRLKIAAQCTLTERFLVVRGHVRTYKIHLGSGNILMEPNDQYLCIVTDKKEERSNNEDKLFLPFDGDKTLSIILSKAFLLADDLNITDTTILSQIGRKV